MRSSVGVALGTYSPAALRETVTLCAPASSNTLNRTGSPLGCAGDGRTMARTSKPGSSAASAKMGRAASIMARTCQDCAPSRASTRASVSPRWTLMGGTTRPGKSSACSSGSKVVFDSTVVCGTGASGNAQRPLGQDFAAGGIGRFLDRLSHESGDLLGIQLLAVLVGQDAVQLEQADVGLLRGIRAVVLLERRRVGVQLERIERRDALGLRSWAPAPGAPPAARSTCSECIRGCRGAA